MNLFNWPVIEKFANKIYLGLVFVVVLGAASYFLVYKPYSIYKDKEKFTKAEASLDPIYNQIVAKVGKPDEVKKYQNCDRPNLKSGQGSLSCNVGINMWYKNKNYSQSNILMQEIVSLNNSAIRIGSSITEGSSFVPTDTNKGLQIFYQSIKSVSGLSCTNGYRYPVIPSLEEQFNSMYSENFEIHVSCSGPAKAQYYPMRDN